MISTRPKHDFLSVRVDPARKTQIEAAAAAMGATVGAFVRDAAEEAARVVLLRELSDRPHPPEYQSATRREVSQR